MSQKKLGVQSLSTSYQSIEELTAKALANIDADRVLTTALLDELIVHMRENKKIDQLSLPAAKFVETLQRSNEQLVKLIQGMRKKVGEGEEQVDLSDDEKDRLYEEIQRAKQE